MNEIVDNASQTKRSEQFEQPTKELIINLKDARLLKTKITSSETNEANLL